MGYERPTPIQAQAIPALLEGRDVVGCAQTGTGKTAAFILPTLQSLGSERGIKALVVTPTRELAIQVEAVARDCAKHTHHRTAAVYGGAGYGQQKARLSKRVDLLVATPGRLLDMQGRGDLDLSGVKVLVLDEADRMLDMGFWPDVKRIIDLLPKKRQSLLFSATMSREVLRVIESTLSDPVHVEVGPKAVPVDAVDQVIYPVNSMQKNQLLVEMLRQQRDLDRVLIFARTKHRADRICKVLRRGNIPGAAIHSNRSQPQRQEALAGFKNGRYRVLVATDIVARGIDVDNISHVINYDVPNAPEDYVHRIGRTARAGAGGTAITFFAPEDVLGLREIEQHVGTALRCEDLEGFEYNDRIVPDPERAARRASRSPFAAHARRRASRGRMRRR